MSMCKTKHQKISPSNFQSMICCNPSFGLATKAKGLQGCGRKESSGDPQTSLKTIIVLNL